MLSKISTPLKKMHNIVPKKEMCRHRGKITTTKCLVVSFSLIPTPIWRVSLFFGREGMCVCVCVCVCVQEHVCVCM